MVHVPGPGLLQRRAARCVEFLCCGQGGFATGVAVSSCDAFRLSTERRLARFFVVATKLGRAAELERSAWYYSSSPEKYA